MSFSKDVPVADTVLALQALAAERGLAAPLTSSMFPSSPMDRRRRARARGPWRPGSRSGMPRARRRSRARGWRAIVVPPGDVTISRSSTGCISRRGAVRGAEHRLDDELRRTSRERPSRMPASIIASARSAKYAGPEPETAVIASMAPPATRTTPPRCARASSARSRCSSPACAPAQRPAIPSCTVDGAFGIARTTGTPSRGGARSGGRDRGRDREHGLLRDDQRPDLAEQRPRCPAASRR